MREGGPARRHAWARVPEHADHAQWASPPSLAPAHARSSATWASSARGGPLRGGPFGARGHPAPPGECPASPGLARCARPAPRGSRPSASPRAWACQRYEGDQGKRPLRDGEANLSRPHRRGEADVDLVAPLAHGRASSSRTSPGRRWMGAMEVSFVCEVREAEHTALFLLAGGGAARADSADEAIAGRGARTNPRRPAQIQRNTVCRDTQSMRLSAPRVRGDFWA